MTRKRYDAAHEVTEADRARTTEALQRYLPRDVPERERLIDLAERHLQLLADANRTLNLTGITTPREAVIKHVVDSVIPTAILRGARSVLDVGTGAGFPGIPLAIVCPHARFVLAESVQKKARFLVRVVRELQLPNVEVYAGRGETWLATDRADAVVVRAVGAASKLIALLGPSAARFDQLLLFKGPAGAEELLEAKSAASRQGLRGEVTLRYDLPDGLGQRCVLRFAGATP